MSLKSSLASECRISLDGSCLTILREIIDESDVYIDVHKAIRRMAPAPKTRIHKDMGSRESIPQTKNDLLIDVSDEHDTTAGHNTTASGSDKKRSVDFGSDGKATFLRRTSTGADGSPVTVPVRGDVNDMREHLKHLGPSNLASRPKTTRYNTVKIKQAQPAAARNSSVDAPSSVAHISQGPHTAAFHGGEGEGLLKSAGRDAKDGVQALQQGYGTLGVSPRSNFGRPSSGGLGTANVDGPAFDESDLPRLDTTTTRGSTGSGKSPYGSESTDTLGSLHTDGTKSRKKRATRSGSITENVIEAGGVRKVVLETNDSPNTDGDVNSATSLLASQQTLYNAGNSEATSTPDDEAPKKSKKKKKNKKKS